MLRDSDLHLPQMSWGRIDLAASASRAGKAWTDNGIARQERGLKPHAEVLTDPASRPSPPGTNAPARPASLRAG